jgi:hypothetical protein
MGSVLLASWLVMTGVATLGWHYRNASYLLAMIPALALIAACFGPFAEGRHAKWMLGAVCVGLAVKAALPGAVWGLNYRSGTVNPLANALSAYCEGPRAANLLVVDLVDDLYAAVLPVPLRYVQVGPRPASGSYRLPFRELGLALGVDEFAERERWRERFEARLRQWGITSVAPVGTVIEASSVAELEKLVRSTPDADFLISERYRVALASTGRRYEVAAPGFGFLRAASEPAVPRREWTCRM